MSYEIIHLIMTIAVTFVGGVLGGFLILTMRDNKLAFSFGISALFAAVWGIFSILFHLTADEALAVPFAGIALLALVFHAVLYFTFITYIAEHSAIAGRYARYRFGVYSAAVFMLGITVLDIVTKKGYVVSGLAEQEYAINVWPHAGPLFPYFAAFIAAVYIACLVFLFKTLVNGKGLIRQDKVLRVLSVTFVGMFGWATNVFLWYGLAILPIGNILLPIYFIVIFLIIVDRRVLNTKVIATELLTLAVLGLLFARVFITENLQERLMDVSILVFVTIFGIFLIRSFLEEVSHRNQLEELATQLRDLNDTLQEKVDAQTQEIKQAYEVEKKAREDLEALDRSKSQFLLMTQHHLRTPLTVIKGHLSALSTSSKFTIPEEAQGSLERISVSTDKMARLINELLDLTQFEIGKDILHKEPVNIARLTGEVCTGLMPAAEKKKLAFTFLFAPEAEDIVIDADIEKMRSAISNVIDNAIKYTREGAVSVQGAVITHPIEKTRQLRIEVSDTGIGMSEKDLAKLFRQFFERGGEAVRMDAAGRGIGLVLTKQIVEAHGGRIWGESKGEGKGSVFYIEIPLQK